MTDRADITDNDGGLLIDDQVSSQRLDGIDDSGDRGADVPVDQPPVVRSQRVRKPNSCSICNIDVIILTFSSVAY